MASTKLSTGFIWAGSLAIFLSLCILPAAFEKNADSAAMGIAGAVFSFGAMTIAIGLYVKARFLQEQQPQRTVVSEKTNAQQRRGGCNLCGTETPVIQCKAHQLELCGNCLTRHYDYRSCQYIPGEAGNGNNSPRTMAARSRY
jgi:hypothetical protein